MAVAVAAANVHVHEADRTKLRELVLDANHIAPLGFIVKTAEEEGEEEEEEEDTVFLWSAWTRAIIPVRKDGWYTRDEASLSLQVLPTHVGGIYEVGISRESDGTAIVAVYVGKAEKVRPTGASGCSLRMRLYRQYAKDGFDLHVELRAFLEANHYVYFRWIVLPTQNLCRAYEKECQVAYNYAFNTVNNLPYRPAEAVVMSRPGAKANLFVHRLVYFRAVDLNAAAADPEIKAVIEGFSELTIDQREKALALFKFL